MASINVHISNPANAPPYPPAARRWRLGRRWFAATLLLIIALGIGLRFWQLGGQSLWYDEGYTAWISAQSPGQITRLVRADVSPPTYYILLHGWRLFFGDSEWALRSFSTAASCLTLLLSVAIARRVLRDRLAVIFATLLAALATLQIEFAQEARSYALAGLCAVAAAYALLRFAAGRKMRWFLAATIAAAVMVYCHNMMWFYLPPLLLVAPLSANRPKPRMLAWMALLAVCVVLLYLLWLSAMLEQMRWIRGNFWATRPTVTTFIQTLGAAGGLKIYPLTALGYALLGRFFTHDLAHALLTLIFAIGPLVAWWLARGKRRNTLFALWLVAVCPLLLIYLYSLLRQPVFIEKIFTPSAALFPVLLAAPLAFLSGRRRAAALVLLGCLVGAHAYGVGYHFIHHINEQWRQAYHGIAPRLTPRTLLVFVGNESQLLFDYYAQRAGQPLPAAQKLGLPQGFFDLDPPRTIQRLKSEADLARLEATTAAGRFDTIVLVLSHTSWSDPRHLTTAWMDRHWRRIQRQEFFDVQLLTYSTARIQ